jgi:hypothetical protein
VPPILTVALVQAISWTVMVMVSLITTMPIGLAVLLSGMVNALLAMRVGLPRWWCWIAFLLPAATAAALSLPIQPLWYLAAFMLMLSVYRGAVKERVPLYLSNRRTLAEVEALLPAASGARVIDLGAGIGTALARLSRKRPDLHFTGVENAPLPYLLACARFVGRRNVTMRFGSLWHEGLSRHDFVYAYLSPAPMPELWKKVVSEMRPGTRFASYRFSVPGVPPSMKIRIGTGRPDWLFLWQR